MTKLQNKLVVVIEMVRHFRRDTFPLFGLVRHHSEYWLQPLAIQLCLVVEVFECEIELLSLRDSVY